MRCKNCGKTSRGYRRCPFCGSRGGKRRHVHRVFTGDSSPAMPICFITRREIHTGGMT